MFLEFNLRKALFTQKCQIHKFLFDPFALAIYNNNNYYYFINNVIKTFAKLHINLLLLGWRGITAL
jgi:hypothetical protein